MSEIDRKISLRAPLEDILSALDKAKDPMRQFFVRQVGDPTLAAALTLKLLNILLAKYHFRERSTAVVSRPFGLLVDPANGCNLACPGCVQSTRAKSLRLFEWGNGLLTADRFGALLAHFGAYVMQIMFCNYGEPTVNPNTPQLIAMAKRYCAQTALSTNLSLARFDAEAYVKSGLDFMFLAIDGASQAVYSRYRKNGDISVVYRNLENLVAAKLRLGKTAPILRWQYLAFEHNAHEIQPALEKAKALGVDQFVVEIPFDVSWDDPDIHPASMSPFHLELTPNTERILADNWDMPPPDGTAEIIEREFSLGWTRYRAEPATDAQRAGAVSAHTCSWLYKSMTLDANGRILPCAAAPKPGAGLVFGNLGENPSDCYNSERYMQARRSFADRAAYEANQADGGSAPYCANCELNQERTEFGSGEVAQYLRTIGHGKVDAAAIEICSNW